MNREIAIELVNVKKTYYLSENIKVEAIRGISLKVYRGDFISIMGPSGSGKTTLLNLIGTMDKPTSGRVIIEGIDVTDLPESQLAPIRREKIGFVFQAYNLITTLTALENVMLPMLLTGKYSEDEAEERAFKLLSLVGLEDRAHHRPNQLSGGQQQRVAIARALANDPSFILMDEPTGAIDTITGSKLMALVKILNQTFGQTFIVVTHNPSVAKTAQKIYFIRDGLLYKSSSKDIYNFNITLSRDEITRILNAQLKLLLTDLKSLKRRFREGKVREENYTKLKGELKRKMNILEEMLKNEK
ncbi:MAG: ABC transporter ATP-binding protein [archaeon GB-1867-005]|nr:ABC transporter ATP-binding protein [Candidatus Culexmicrobium cathedralense]